MSRLISIIRGATPRHSYTWALLLLIQFSPLRAAADTLSASQMSAMYAAELGTLYHPADLGRIYSAHLLLEQYFAPASQAQRRDIVKQLEATKLPAELLGRVSRLRLSWENIAPGVYYINDRSGPYAVKYFLGIPKTYHRDISWPLVVKLPASNSFLDDPMPNGDDVAQMYSDWIKDELANHPDALVLMPLLNLKELYGPSYLGMNSVIQPILDAANRCNVDPARVYMIGHSMAAHAVWNIALHYPTYFAAINSLAGAANADWQRLRLSNLRNVLPVIWADTADQVIPAHESSDIVTILRKQKIDVDYTQTDGVGHIPPPEVLKKNYLTLRTRRRDLYPAHVSIRSDRPDTVFNRVDWIQVYQELDSGPDQSLRLQWGTGSILLNQNAYAVEAVLDHNTVTMATQNVGIMRLFFNSQMVDMSKPVTVSINGVVRFNGVLTEDLDEMLKDELFIGRGWRYFPATVDLDLLDEPKRPPASAAAKSTSPTTRPHGRIVIYNDDGSVQRIIETP